MDSRNGSNQESQDSRLESPDDIEVEVDSITASNVTLSNKFSTPTVELIANPNNWADIREKDRDHDARLGLLSL